MTRSYTPPADAELLPSRLDDVSYPSAAEREWHGGLRVLVWAMKTRPNLDPVAAYLAYGEAHGWRADDLAGQVACLPQVAELLAEGMKESAA